jgi:hypothetical protein
MNIKTRIFIVVCCILLSGVPVRAESTSSREYQLKAAYLYNFIKFIEWPEEKMADANEPIIIGVIGKNPFGDAFELIKDDKVKGRKVIVKWVKGFEELKKSDKAEMYQTIEDVRKCHLLFICSSEEKTSKEIMDLVKDCSVLTVAEILGFLESGGIINLSVEDKKIRFEINNVNANQAKLKISSQLLRLAKTVDGKKPSPEANNNRSVHVETWPKKIS